MDTFGAIPCVAIYAWLEYWQIDDCEADFIIDIIQQLDNIFLTHIAKKRNNG